MCVFVCTVPCISLKISFRKLNKENNFKSVLFQLNRFQMHFSLKKVFAVDTQFPMPLCNFLIFFLFKFQISLMDNIEAEYSKSKYPFLNIDFLRSCILNTAY